LIYRYPGFENRIPLARKWVANPPTLKVAISEARRNAWAGARTGWLNH